MQLSTVMFGRGTTFPTTQMYDMRFTVNWSVEQTFMEKKNVMIPKKVYKGGEDTHLTKHITVQDLEHFIKSKFAETLHGVTNKGWSPALGQSTCSILSQGDFETV